MSLTINHNLMAGSAARNLNTHYGALGTSVRRLSSGLRVGTAADDAAGLAIRELMRSDIRSLNQGIRNANDAVSMIQTADGALSIIDEKLIRMKELATQAATGTYNSDQRIIINSEFQAMAMEIQRISQATDFNGIKLLDGSLDGTHDGSGLTSSGAAKIHFGTGNDCAEDYYYMNVGDASLEGLILGTTIPETIPRINDRFDNGDWERNILSGIIPVAYIPKGSKNVTIQLDAHPDHILSAADDDDIALFTRDGHQLVGSVVGPNPPSATAGSNDEAWDANGVDIVNVNNSFITQSNGFTEDAVYDSSLINSGGGVYSANSGTRTSSIRGMSLSYGGDGDWFDSTVNASNNDLNRTVEYFHIDETTEDLLLFSIGIGSFAVNASWDEMTEVDYSTVNGMQVTDIRTQESAQTALEQIDEAIVHKDKIRANLGAMQNRLENTITNLSIQAENLQASESRISDVDVATEMTEFVRRQILTQSATAMLAQANSLPKMAMQLIGG